MKQCSVILEIFCTIYDNIYILFTWLWQTRYSWLNAMTSAHIHTQMRWYPGLWFVSAINNHTAARSYVRVPGWRCHLDALQSAVVCGRVTQRQCSLLSHWAFFDAAWKLNCSRILTTDTVPVKLLYCCVTHFHFPGSFFAVAVTLKSIDYNVAMRFIHANNSFFVRINLQLFGVWHLQQCFWTMTSSNSS